MKYLITLVLLLSFSTLFSQWTRVQQLPASDVFTLFHKDNVVYAGGTNVIYVSNNNGQTWNLTTPIPGLSPVSSIINNIIVFKNELYAAAPLHGVFKSPDGGATWQSINTGLGSSATVNDFCEYRGDLYAATAEDLGKIICKLNPVGRNDWLPFSDGLNTGLIITSIIGNNNALVAGTGANAMYDYLPAGDTVWQERLLLGQISPNERVYDIITAHDSLFLAGSSGRFYMSTDNGLNWTLAGSSLISNAATIVNAKQAIFLSARNFDGISFNTDFFYIKKDSLQNPFVNFSIVRNFFTYKMDIAGNKLWAASDNGLFFMFLSDLPGITNAEDSVPLILPVRFTSFTANCQSGKAILTWKTAQEQNSSHFDIERSIDGIHWTVIGNEVAAGNSGVEQTYSFTDYAPLENNLYRIVEYDLDGRVHQTDTIRSSCTATNDLLSVKPNPVHDKLFINITTGNASPGIINIYDSKGALVKTQRVNLLSGSNQLALDVSTLARGIYSLLLEWNNGQIKKTVKVVKQ
ncbi:T9SS type A sorting domain-containing protein [Ferruginibacter profundus]